MYYVLYSSSGNMLASFDDPDEARRSLNELVRQEPDIQANVAVVVYDPEGEPTGEAILPDDPTLPHTALRALAGVEILLPTSTAIRGIVQETTRFVAGPADLQEAGPWEPATTEGAAGAIRR